MYAFHHSIVYRHILLILTVSVATRPVLIGLVILVAIPEVLDESPNVIRCSNLLKAEIRIILHRLRLSQGHFYTIPLIVKTTESLVAVKVDTALNHLIVSGLSVAQGLHHHVFVFRRCFLGASIPRIFGKVGTHRGMVHRGGYINLQTTTRVSLHHGGTSRANTIQAMTYPVFSILTSYSYSNYNNENRKSYPKEHDVESYDTKQCGGSG